jgi:hypothetical protein
MARTSRKWAGQPLPDLKEWPLVLRQCPALSSHVFEQADSPISHENSREYTEPTASRPTRSKPSVKPNSRRGSYHPVRVMITWAWQLRLVVFRLYSGQKHDRCSEPEAL